MSHPGSWLTKKKVKYEVQSSSRKKKKIKYKFHNILLYIFEEYVLELNTYSIHFPQIKSCWLSFLDHYQNIGKLCIIFCRIKNSQTSFINIAGDLIWYFAMRIFFFPKKSTVEHNKHEVYCWDTERSPYIRSFTNLQSVCAVLLKALIIPDFLDQQLLISNF